MAEEMKPLVDTVLELRRIEKGEPPVTGPLSDEEDA